MNLLLPFRSATTTVHLLVVHGEDTGSWQFGRRSAGAVRTDHGLPATSLGTSPFPFHSLPFLLPSSTAVLARRPVGGRLRFKDATNYDSSVLTLVYTYLLNTLRTCGLSDRCSVLERVGDDIANTIEGLENFRSGLLETFANGGRQN